MFVSPTMPVLIMTLAKMLTGPPPPLSRLCQSANLFLGEETPIFPVDPMLDVADEE